MFLTKQEIIGTWSLTKFKIKKEHDFNNWSAKTTGILIYTNEGYMSVAINGRMPKSEWFDSILFYAGTYEISKSNEIIHHVKNASLESNIGISKHRKAKLTEDNLTLSDCGDYGEAFIEWHKV